MRYNNEEVSDLELMALIPEQAYRLIAKINPDELESNVKHQTKVDDQYKSEVLLAFSYYETLTTKQRELTKYSLSNLTIGALLNWIGKNNEKLLDRIEALYDKGIGVIDYLENQLIRSKAMILSFDEIIREKQNGNNPNQKTA